MSGELGIRAVAERSGIAAGTIRMWEQRYGFPVPERTPSGYRRYAEADVEALRRVAAYRTHGLSVPAAIERACATQGTTDHPSIYAAVLATEGDLQRHVLSKPTLRLMSKAIEDEAIARAAAPVIFGAFQQTGFYRDVAPRWRRLAAAADAAVVFADFPAVRRVAGAPVEVPIAPDDVLGNEWAVIIDAPGYAACLLAWEQPDRHERGGSDDGARCFETAWTMDPTVTRRAAEIAGTLAGRADRKLGAQLAGLLEDRPLAIETPAPALTALTNRMVGYLEA